MEKAHALDIAVVAGKQNDQEKNHEKGQASRKRSIAESPLASILKEINSINR